MLEILRLTEKVEALEAELQEAKVSPQLPAEPNPPKLSEPAVVEKDQPMESLKSEIGGSRGALSG